VSVATEAPTLVLGAGPAGLTAGYALARRGAPVVVVEADDQVGGLARTVTRDGFRFDLGGHRFFTKSPEVEALWREVLGEEFLLRPRLSRIYWNGRFLDYPLSAGDVLRKLGPVEAVRVTVSYVCAALRPHGDEETFEQWVSNRFGRRLFELFFRTYTEKVWGVPCSEIRAEWAAQRIRGLSLASAVRTALVGDRDQTVRSLIREFHYPRLGPGQMWEAMSEAITAGGGEVRLGAPVEAVHLDRGRVAAVTAGGRTIPCARVISSLPLGVLAAAARPRAPEAVLDAARGLRHRDFLTVALVLRGAEPFPDTWIYIHDPGVRVGRIQNFRAWSPWMVPDPDRSCVGLEYFCFAGDDLWSLDDDALVDLAADELARLGLVARADVEGGYAVRVRRAYPIYDAAYAGRVDTLRGWLAGLENLQQVGRNGLHRYNNSDHSMLTALRAVENALDGCRHDLWAVNADGAYHEEAEADEHPYRRAPDVPATGGAGA
jgi:protoporphyrinogen oxidase